MIVTILSAVLPGDIYIFTENQALSQRNGILMVKFQPLTNELRGRFWQLEQLAVPKTMPDLFAKPNFSENKVFTKFMMAQSITVVYNLHLLVYTCGGYRAILFQVRFYFQCSFLFFLLKSLKVQKITIKKIHNQVNETAKP